MQLLRTVIYINEQKIIKQQVLDKIILIKTLLICHKKILYLKSRNLANHINIFASAVNYKHIFKAAVVINLEKLVS